MTIYIVHSRTGLSTINNCNIIILIYPIQTYINFNINTIKKYQYFCKPSNIEYESVYPQMLCGLTCIMPRCSVGNLVSCLMLFIYGFPVNMGTFIDMTFC